MKTIITTLALLLIVSACGEEQPPGADPFGADTWVLVSGTVDGTALVLVDGRLVTLRVENGQIGGTSACNAYGGEITLEDGIITFGPLFMTEMYCEDVADLEAAYHAALGRVNRVERQGEQLVLSGSGVELRFDVQPPEPDAALVGTDWALETIVEGETASTPAAPATLLFAADGTVSGSTGCNSLFGDYAAGTGFGPLGTTKMYCDGVMEQETLVLEILGPDATLVIEGSTLTISDLEGRALVFRAQG